MRIAKKAFPVDSMAMAAGILDSQTTAGRLRKSIPSHGILQDVLPTAAILVSDIFYVGTGVNGRTTKEEAINGPVSRGNEIQGVFVSMKRRNI